MIEEHTDAGSDDGSGGAPKGRGLDAPFFGRVLADADAGNGGLADSDLAGECRWVRGGGDSFSLRVCGRYQDFFASGEGFGEVFPGLACLVVTSTTPEAALAP